MTTETQLTEIRNYLLSKKLPLDIIPEVEDHFSTQLADMQREKELTSSEAFLETKKLWQKDLGMVRKSFFSFVKIPRIAKEMMNASRLDWSKTAFAISSILLVLLFLAAKFILQEYYFFIALFDFLIIRLFTSAATLYFAVAGSRRKTLADNFIFTEIGGVILIYMGLSLFGFYHKLPTNDFKVVYDFINGIPGISTFDFISVCVQFLFGNAIAVYLFLMLKSRMKSLKVIKKFA